MLRSMSAPVTLLLLLLLLVTATGAFAPTGVCKTSRPTTLSTTKQVALPVLWLSSSPDRNPDKPELPVIAGDYDWDAKFAGDADWLVGDAVPGKKVMNEIELAQQVTALGALEEKWRKDRIESEYAASINVGFVPTAELANGRTAMFFLVTGLLTEYWTGISLPGQVEELLRVLGIIGM
jgi:hypothetical protein